MTKQAEHPSTCEDHDPDPQTATSTLGLISWALYDWGGSAFSTVIQTFVFAAYFTRQVAENEMVGSAQWGNTLSAAAFCVALGGPVLGAVADQGGRRKPWIAAFTLLSVLATGSLWFIEPSRSFVLPALLLVGLGTVGSELAVVFYNAMLPALVRRKRLGRWSGWGWGLGYVGGLACLVAALLAFIKPDDPLFGLDRGSAQHIRATFVLAAGWYLLFALPLLLFTPDTAATAKRFPSAVRDGLRQLAGSIREVRRYAHIVRFLIARMIYIDGLATVFAFGGVYAAGTFGMNEQQVLVFGIWLNVTAGLGAAAFAWLDDRVGSRRTILFSLAGLTAFATLILLVHSLELFWTFGLLLGIFVGPVQASSRSFMAKIAPKSLRNQMFGLYALSGKATSFLGPVLVGWVTVLANSQRAGMSTIVAFFILGGVLMLTVPPAEAH